jgi:hypothetical protein
MVVGEPRHARTESVGGQPTDSREPGFILALPEEITDRLQLALQTVSLSEPVPNDRRGDAPASEVAFPVVERILDSSSKEVGRDHSPVGGGASIVGVLG